jgi:hypothetical protein
MQTNLHSFFTIKTVHNEKHKRCFIYDPTTYKAFFAVKPDDAVDRFICTKIGVKLYVRGLPEVTFGASKEVTFAVLKRSPSAPAPKGDTSEGGVSLPTIHTTCDIPLLKSNIQKAIRRGNVSVAVSTALAIIQKDPIQLLRRLSIIYVEDVCMIDSFPIVIWLMMADSNYKMTSCDICIILQIVYSLCCCSHYFDFDVGDAGEACNMDYTHELLEKENCYNEVLCLHYRRLYGGLKGDMKLLLNAIKFYVQYPQKIIQYQFLDSIPCSINRMVQILPESVDFHPFPGMISFIRKKTSIDEQLIRDCIWFAESAYNIRKPHTMEASAVYKSNPMYLRMVPYLNKAREAEFIKHIIKAILTICLIRVFLILDIINVEVKFLFQII